MVRFVMSIFFGLYGVAHCSGLQTAQAVPSLSAVKNEVELLSLSDLLTPKSDNIGASELLRNLEAAQDSSKKLGKLKVQLSRFDREADWPDVYAEKALPVLRQLDQAAEQSLSISKRNDFRRKRFVLGLSNQGWYSLVTFDSYRLIDVLEIDAKQLERIKKRLEPFERKLDRLKQKESDLRMSFLVDCCSQLSDRQISTLRKCLKIQDERQMVKRYPPQAADRTGDDQLVELTHLMVVSQLFVAQGVKKQIELPKLSIDTTKELRKIHQELVKVVFSGAAKSLNKKALKKRTNEFRRKIQSELGLEHFDFINRQLFPSAIASTMHPGFSFSHPVVIDVLELSEKQINRLAAEQYDVAAKTVELRKEFCLLQDEAIAAAMACLRRMQTEKFKEHVGETFRWEIDPRLTR